MPGKVTAGWPDTIGPDRGYFEMRDTWLDTRGPIVIHPEVTFGFEVMVITASHLPSGDPGSMGTTGIKFRLVQIDRHAYIGNRAVLFNCHVCEQAVVGAGAVVKGVVIPPWHLAEGSPARLVAKWWGGKWHRLPIPLVPEAFEHANP